ncbi:hypothetical protein ABE25_13380 [Cytobacillus firmus]|nr:hypothetical protein [Cytobacillus firmus]MBG9603141.1 hypothetical protein [Cytobacillus firmus]
MEVVDTRLRGCTGYILNRLLDEEGYKVKLTADQIYQGPEFSGYALHIDKKGISGGLDIFVSSIELWLEGRGWRETKE